MPNTIPSLYNFVPLSCRVFFPDWQDKVCHDVPFSKNVISGWFTIKVTTETPTYIRNGGFFERDRENPTGALKCLEGESDSDYRARCNAFVEFFQVTPGGDYAIPGTSLRGVIRNVVEIASFGKISRVDDRRYGVRDLNNPDPGLYSKRMTHNLGGVFAPAVKSGWLVQDDLERWYIVPCECARIDHSLIEAVCGAGRMGRRTSQDGSKEKYDAWASEPLERDCQIDGLRDHRHSCGHLRYQKVLSITGGKTKGTLVFTGQPMNRDKKQTDQTTGRDVWVRVPKRKHMEFLFFNPSISQLGGKPKLPVPAKHLGGKSVKEDFLFIHSDVDGRPNVEWGFWKSKLDARQPVPVFYLLDSRGEVSSVGLAMMYRLPYVHSIYDTIRHTNPNHFSEKPDLADLIFGFVQGQPRSLRGRVSFETLVCPQKDATLLSKKTRILGGPKPTYYPTYVRQPLKSNGSLNGWYKTYMNDDSEISGWKRYPAGNPLDTSDVSPSKSSTSFRPLDGNAVFEGSVHVHNLQPKELGALIWTLTWGGKPKYRHKLGMAKPFGYGVVKIEIKDASGLKTLQGNPVDLLACQNEYIQMMEAFMSSDGGWEASPQIQSLLAMADPKTEAPHELRYPKLTVNPNANEFGELKQSRAVLPSFVSLQWHSRPGGARARPTSRSSEIATEKRPVSPTLPSSSAVAGGPSSAQRDSASADSPNAQRGRGLDFVAAEKKRNGRWRFEIELGRTKYSGFLQKGSEKLPKDLKEGSIVKLKVINFNAGSFQLELP